MGDRVNEIAARLADGEAEERVRKIRGAVDAALRQHPESRVAADMAFLLAENARLTRERDEARAELEVERRKDHAYNAWTGGYNAAIADWQAGRTALWPGARTITPEVAP